MRDARPGRVLDDGGLVPFDVEGLGVGFEGAAIVHAALEDVADAVMGERAPGAGVDRDQCFGGEFEAAVQSAGVESLATPYHAPNAHAHCERWIRRAREECLNHLILFGLKSLRRTMSLSRGHFNECPGHIGD